MNINYKQPQFELFPGNSGSPDDATKPRYLLANLTLTAENLVVLGILGIMVAVFAYSLGVERGKYVTAAQYREMTLAKPVVVQMPAVVANSTGAIVSTTSQVPAPPAGKATVPVTPVLKPAVAVMTSQKPQTPVANFKYTIQVASYADQKFAHRAAVDLNKRGFETVVMQKGKYAILCVGKFAQKNEAIATITRLKSKYKDCLVRSM